MRKAYRTRLMLLAAAPLFTACHKDSSSQAPPPPAAQTTNNTNGGSGPPVASSATAVTNSSAPSAGGALVFKDELRSGGGAFVYPNSDNQDLTLEDRSNPLSANSIRYTWNGGDVKGQHVFAALALINTPSLAGYQSAPGTDLRGGSYRRVTFDARGSLSADTVLKIEVADDHRSGIQPPCVVLSASGRDDDSHGINPATCENLGTLQTTWQRYALPVSASDLQSVKDYFKATFVFKSADSAPPGHGGTVYFDEIQYEP